MRLDGPSVRTLHVNLDEALGEEPDQGEDGIRISGKSRLEFPEPTSVLKDLIARHSRSPSQPRRRRGASGCICDMVGQRSNLRQPSTGHSSDTSCDGARSSDISSDIALAKSENRSEQSKKAEKAGRLQTLVCRSDVRIEASCRGFLEPNSRTPTLSASPDPSNALDFCAKSCGDTFSAPHHAESTGVRRESYAFTAIPLK